MSIESVMPSNHLILCCPLLLLPSIFPSIRVFSSKSALHISLVKLLGIQLQNQFFQWKVRVDFLSDWLVWSPCSLRDTQDSSPAPKFESINSSVLSLLYGPTLTSIDDYWIIALIIETFVSKVMSLFFNILSRFFIAFLLINEDCSRIHRRTILDYIKTYSGLFSKCKFSDCSRALSFPFLQQRLKQLKGECMCWE